MKRILTQVLVLCLLLPFAGCGQAGDGQTAGGNLRQISGSVEEGCAEQESGGTSGTGTEWVEYVFDDSSHGVKFSVRYPKDWTLIDQRAHDGDENRDASPSTGIEFAFPGYDGDSLTIMAMRLFPFEVDDNLFVCAPFETDAGLAGVKYAREADGLAMVYFIFGDGETLPQYFAAVNMSSAHYEALEGDVEAVAKTLKVLTE